MSKTFGGNWDPLTTLFGSNGQIFAWQIIQQCKKRILNKREWFRGELKLSIIWMFFVIDLNGFKYIYIFVRLRFMVWYISCMWYNYLELLLYSFSVVCRGHFMIYYDHYILAQGGIHNITAFAVAFNFIFTPHHTSFGDITLCNFDVFRISVSSSDDLQAIVQPICT